jgi:hypothetical protein
MVNVFSFCLYGPSNPRYYPGMLENVYLVGKYFPTWKVYVYYAPDVEQSMVNRLAACSNVVLFPTGITGEKNMIRRFCAIDEPGVELMMVRDADSRIHWKDRWAIREFVASPCVASTIRDNVEHTAFMMGGLWGLKKSAGLHLQTEYSNYIEDESLGWRNAHDQNFLADVIYPKVLSRLLVHFSVGPVFSGEEYRSKFPFEWTNDIYCGRVEMNYVDMPEPKTTRFGFLPPVLLRMSDVPIAQAPAPPQTLPPEREFIPSKPETHTLHFLNKR